ncbi:hypothetical protein IQ5_04196 [Streptococcus thermophilus MTCC 5460]|nr:hypothetical protein IQ5_04196 [Streptococcus thermophilus MTCC 5460]
MNCTPKVRQKKSNFWGIFIMKLTYEDKVQIYELRKQGKNRYYSPKLKQEMIDKILLKVVLNKVFAWTMASQIKDCLTIG